MEISKIKINDIIYQIKDEATRQKLMVKYHDGGVVSSGYIYNLSDGNYHKIVAESNISIVINGEGQIGDIVSLQLDNPEGYVVTYGDKIVTDMSDSFVIRFVRGVSNWQILSVNFAQKNMSESFASYEQYLELYNRVNTLQSSLKMKYYDTSTISFSNNTVYNVTSKLTNINFTLNSLTLRNAVCVFGTGSSVAFSCNINSSFKINKPFSFEADKYYIIGVDNGVILWTEISQYSE